MHSIYDNFDQEFSIGIGTCGGMEDYCVEKIL